MHITVQSYSNSTWTVHLLSSLAEVQQGLVANCRAFRLQQTLQSLGIRRRGKVFGTSDTLILSSLSIALYKRTARQSADRKFSSTTSKIFFQWFYGVNVQLYAGDRSMHLILSDDRLSFRELIFPWCMLYASHFIASFSG